MEKMKVYVFPVRSGFQAFWHGSKGCCMHGATRKTKPSAKQSFVEMANEMRLPRENYAFKQ